MLYWGRHRSGWGQPSTWAPVLGSTPYSLKTLVPECSPQSHGAPLFTCSGNSHAGYKHSIIFLIIHLPYKLLLHSFPLYSKTLWNDVSNFLWDLRQSGSPSLFHQNCSINFILWNPVVDPHSSPSLTYQQFPHRLLSHPHRHHAEPTSRTVQCLLLCNFCITSSGSFPPPCPPNVGLALGPLLISICSHFFDDLTLSHGFKHCL